MTLRYDLPSLRQHTSSIREIAEALTRANGELLREGLVALRKFVRRLEAEPISLSRNVRLLLACRFFNHVYSALVLSEAGLVVDSIVCERTAIETLAAFRLVTAAPVYAEEYSSGKFPRPSEVRKLLESLGHASDVKYLRELYASGSEMVHVTRANERFNTEWRLPESGELLFGGRLKEPDHLQLIEFLGAACYWFLDDGSAVSPDESEEAG